MAWFVTEALGYLYITCCCTGNEWNTKKLILMLLILFLKYLPKVSVGSGKQHKIH